MVILWCCHGNHLIAFLLHEVKRFFFPAMTKVWRTLPTMFFFLFFFLQMSHVFVRLLSKETSQCPPSHHLQRWVGRARQHAKNYSKLAGAIFVVRSIELGGGENIFSSHYLWNRVCMTSSGGESVAEVIGSPSPLWVAFAWKCECALPISVCNRQSFPAIRRNNELLKKLSVQVA